MIDWTSIIVAVIAAVGSFLGVYFSNRKSAKENLALINYRMDKAESKTAEVASAENKLEERTGALEKTAAIHDEQIRGITTRVSSMEHKLS